MKKRISIFLFLLISISGVAQTAGYKYSADLGRIETSGFYNIVLTPELTKHLKTDLSDIRVCDSSGRWIPHLLQMPAYSIARDAVLVQQKYSITENSLINTNLIIGPVTDTISNLVIEIKNSTEKRFFDLSGSDDREAWSVINDSILPVSAASGNKTTSRLAVYFPAVHYTYIKLHIRNNTRDPFGIINIATETVVKEPGKVNADQRLIENPVGTFTQKDSGKVSYITVIQPGSFLFSNFSISVAGPKYFSREAALYMPDAGARGAFPGRLIQSFTISNNSTSAFSCPQVKGQKFYLCINNADNTPVIISNVKTAYNYTYLSTYLEQGKSYRLIFDNPAAVLPDYDLNKLNAGIIDNSLPYLSPKNITGIEEQKNAVAPAKNNRLLLWSAIILILCLLLFFTSGLLKETNKRNDDHL